MTELKTVCSWGCNPKEAIERKICKLLPDIQDLGLFARTSACEQDTQKRDPIDHSTCYQSSAETTVSTTIQVSVCGYSKSGPVFAMQLNDTQNTPRYSSLHTDSTFFHLLA